ncbi:hypothetical protein F5148DRAFT_1154725 [Russula earlei]|uniref:Uncharacterized protein n=1 Tax=Russula earlei TaxID=71964 RepID=A0ACC0TR57_9AGAM|nr:hypothetical protein F5148DRAFT_1154725 [Russula earlei]
MLGPFTREEVGQIHAALGMYKKENDLDDEQLDDLIYSSQPTNGFGATSRGGVKSIFYHVQCACDPLAKAGKWGAAEDEQLCRAVQKKGNGWVAVTELVQHSPADCSDWFHQHTNIRASDGEEPGLWRRKANFFMQLRSWPGKVNWTCPLEDFGFPLQRPWEQPGGHQSSVKANGL